MSCPSESTADMASEPCTVVQSTVNSPALDSQPQPEQQGHVLHVSDVGAATQGDVDSSPPLPHRPIPVGAVIISHLMQTTALGRKRKRGPKKCVPDCGVPVSTPPLQIPTSDAMPESLYTPVASPHVPEQMDAQSPEGGSTSNTVKNTRGRPVGSRNKKQPNECLGSTAMGFMPYTVKVNEGEDILSKIMSISRSTPGAVSVLSATGAIANVTLALPAASEGIATYQGCFDIASLSGSFMLSDASNQKSRTRRMKISLTGPSGRVFGGSVAGLLVAASTVRVVCVPQKQGVL